MNLSPLGEDGWLAHFDTEADAAGFANRVDAALWPWVLDVVPAYVSVAVFFDPAADRNAVGEQLREIGSRPGGTDFSEGRLFCVPVCYEMNLDLTRVAEHCGIDAETVIAKHTATEYRVFAIGFCPGFPYLGYLPKELEGVPRLETPRLKVEPGSVGLTGRQTGVYPLQRPGGWNIVGRTPLVLVDVADGFFPLRVGDRVRFERIDEAECVRLRGERLSPVP